MTFPAFGLAVALAFFLLEMSPLVISLWIAVRRRATMRRKLLFVGTATAMSYGVLLALFALVCLPVIAFVIFLVPALKGLGYLQSSDALAVAEFVARWWWLMLPPSVAVVAVVVIGYMEKRWNGIVNALQG
jgi:Flp pilus assembly pilin Flp